jgi:hypothetical protein
MDEKHFNEEGKPVYLDDLIAIFQREMRQKGYNLSLETCREIMQAMKITFAEAVEIAEPNSKIHTPAGTFLLRLLPPTTKRMPNGEYKELPYRTNLVLRNHHQMEKRVKMQNEKLKNS